MAKTSDNRASDELTRIEGGDDHLHACVSARVPYLGPLVLVVVRLVAEQHPRPAGGASPP